MCNGSAYIYSYCEIMKSSNNFVVVRTPVQHSINSCVLLSENIPTCMCGSID